MPRSDKGGGHKVTPKVQSNQCPRFSNGKPLQAWAFEAYTLHVGRGQSVLSLAKQYGVEWRVVRRNIDAAHAAVCEANDSDALPALEKHKARLLEVLKSAYQDYARADNEKRPGFLRIILDTSEKLAAAEGVVTDRKSLALGQDPALEPVGGDALEQLTSAIARLAARGDGTGSAEEPDA
jgi:hypothetical protein